mmetsp:Transcript_14186/g.23658  ORF Transcript_14186/g.23658 Transcript_14186/m.23658 type:complete len:89 (-) Transcript_14186:200-466(-)
MPQKQQASIEPLFGEGATKNDSADKKQPDDNYDNNSPGSNPCNPGESCCRTWISILPKIPRPRDDPTGRRDITITKTFEEDKKKDYQQ